MRRCGLPPAIRSPVRGTGRPCAWPVGPVERSDVARRPEKPCPCEVGRRSALLRSIDCQLLPVAGALLSRTAMSPGHRCAVRGTAHLLNSFQRASASHHGLISNESGP